MSNGILKQFNQGGEVLPFSSSSKQPKYHDSVAVSHYEVPHKKGRSGPELIASIPDPTLPDYISRFDANDLEGTFGKVGMKVLNPRSSILGFGHVVAPGTIDMALRDGQLYALLPGVHAYRTHGLQPKPYVIQSTISFDETSDSGSGRQEFDGGIVLTLGPSEVGYAYNVPSGCSSEEMGSGVILLPPGTWIIRTPILVARTSFECTTTGSRGLDGSTTYVQEVDVGVMDMAKPRLVYVPFNHSAMFIDGNTSQICDQGFHWASAGIEIAGPWPQHEQRFTHRVQAKTLDNMIIDIEAESWVQMVNPERYVRVAGKEVRPQTFVEDKLMAKVKQHVARINALAIRASEAQAQPPAPANTSMGIPVPPPAQEASGFTEPVTDPGEEAGATQAEDIEAVIVTAPEPDSPSEQAVFNRIKSLLDEVRGFVDGREDIEAQGLANEVQEALSKAGLSLISMAALTVSLPAEIANQIEMANKEAIKAQTEQATNHAKAQKHIAEKYSEIRKKKADREEETRDAENQVTLQRSKARLAEAEEFAKRQAKRAEQKVEQSLELQALEHRMVREQTRIDNELALLEKEAELIAKQEEIEQRRLALARRQQERDNLEADIAAYRATTEAKAAREGVNQQTLVAEIMRNLGKPLSGSKILTINGGGASGDSEGSSNNNGGVGMLPQLLAMREIMSSAQELDCCDKQ